MKTTRKTSAPARVIALLLCVLLAGIILLMCGIASFNYLTVSETVYLTVSSDADLTELKMEQILLKIDSLAEQYSFDSEKLKEVITRENIAEFDQQVAMWWSGLLTKGNATEAPSFDLSFAEELLDTDEHFSEGLLKYEVKEKKKGVLKELRETVENTVLPVRSQVIYAAASKLLNRFPVKSLLKVARNMTLPLLAAAFCLSGLLALVTSKKLRGSLICFGGTFGAVGLVLALIIVLFMILNIRGMIGEISGIFLRQYEILERGMLLRIGATTVIMLGAGIAGLILGKRKATDKERISA